MFGLSKIADTLQGQISAVLLAHGLEDALSKLDLSSLKDVDDLLGKLSEEGAIDGPALSNAFADVLSETSGTIHEIAGQVLEAAQVEEAETAGAPVEAIIAEPFGDDLDSVQVHADGADHDLGASDMMSGDDDVYVGPQPDDAHLAAHEAAHVVQGSDTDSD